MILLSLHFAFDRLPQIRVNICYRLLLGKHGDISPFTLLDAEKISILPLSEETERYICMHCQRIKSGKTRQANVIANNPYQ
jgi:hypothetical protein